MTQHPHDEFDDVPPYKSDEVGKHRAPGSPAAAGGATRGGLKWIGLFAAFVLVIGAIAYVISQFGSDQEEPAAGPDAEQTAEADETGEPEAQTGEETNDDAQNGEGEDDGAEETEATAEETPDVDMDYGLIVYNFDGTPGVAGEVRGQLDEAGFNVVSQRNWNQGWTTCQEDPPVVVHPPAEEELAAVVADELDAATCASDGWTGSDVIAVAVGAESVQ